MGFPFRLFLEREKRMSQVYICYLLQTVRASQLVQLVKNPPDDAGNARDSGLIPELGRSPGGGNGNPPQDSCPGKSRGERSLVGYSPWYHKELDTTVQVHARMQAVMCRQDTQTVSAVISTLMTTFWSLCIYWLFLVCALVSLFGPLRNLGVCTECLYAPKHKHNRWRLDNVQ